jgi:transcriptional regulator with XRE-family HTH domain
MLQDPEQLVGLRIKELRKAQNLTLRMLSERCDLSANAISQIERGENSATIASLGKIASALQVSITDLFHKNHYQNIFHLKKGQGLGKNGENFTIQSLGFGLENNKIEPFHIVLYPNTDMTEEAMSHPGQEFVYCLSGEIIFIVNDQEFNLQKGDSLLFDSALFHEYRNITEENAELLLITQSSIDPNMAKQQHFVVMEKSLFEK